MNNFKRFGKAQGFLQSFAKWMLLVALETKDHPSKLQFKGFARGKNRIYSQST